MEEKVLGIERNMRPGHSHCQSTGSVNEAQATAMWGNWDRTSAAQGGLWEHGAQRRNTKGNSIKR